MVGSVRVNGVDLEYLEEGSGVPVIFSHGGASDLRYWEPQWEAFAGRYRFVAFSRRFHGASSRPPAGDASADVHTGDLVAVIHELGMGPVHLVGFSTALGLRVALRAPELVRTFTIVEPNVPWLLEGEAEGEAVLAWWRAENERVRAGSAGDGELEAKLWFELVNQRGPGAFDAQPTALRGMWLENFGARGLPAPPPEPLTCDLLGAITAPTLAIGAEHGMPYSRAILDRLAACIPGCRKVVIPGVTHFMSYQAPESFNDVVMGFLARQS